MKIVIDVSEKETNKKLRRAPLKFALSVRLSILLGPTYDSESYVWVTNINIMKQIFYNFARILIS